MIPSSADGMAAVLERRPSCRWQGASRGRRRKNENNDTT